MNYTAIPTKLNLGMPLLLTSTKEIVYFAYRHGSDIIVIHLNNGVRTYTAHEISEFVSVPNKSLTDNIKLNVSSIQYGWFYLKDEIEQYPISYLTEYIRKNGTYMMWYFLHLSHAEVPLFDIVNIAILKPVIISNVDINDGVVYSGFGIILSVEYTISKTIHTSKFLYPLFIDAVTNLGDLNIMANFIFDLGNSFIFKEGIVVTNPSINQLYIKKANLNEWK